jgi:hypothetical protein
MEIGVKTRLPVKTDAKGAVKILRAIPLAMDHQDYNYLQSVILLGG